MAAQKILHVITGLDRGGAEAVLTRLAIATDRARFTTRVVSLTNAGAYGTALRAAGIPVETMGLERGKATWRGFKQLRALLRRENSDLVMSWLYHADLAALLATALLPRMRLIWNLRCSAMDLSPYSKQTQRVSKLLVWLSRRPEAVVANSEAGKTFHESIGYRPKAWHVVPNGIDTGHFWPDPVKRAAWRSRLGLADNVPLIGMVARLDPMKDHTTFLAAASRIAAARPEAHFLVAGTGTEMLASNDLAHRLHALGERADIHEILPALDLFMLSSAFGEGFPNVIAEAMASAVPTIATDVGDAAAIIGETGGAVPPGNPEALAKAALDLLALDATTRRAHGDAARRRVVGKYSLPTMVAAYEAIFAGEA